MREDTLAPLERIQRILSHSTQVRHRYATVPKEAQSRGRLREGVEVGEGGRAAIALPLTTEKENRRLKVQGKGGARLYY